MTTSKSGRRTRSLRSMSPKSGNSSSGKPPHGWFTQAGRAPTRRRYDQGGFKGQAPDPLALVKWNTFAFAFGEGIVACLRAHDGPKAPQTASRLLALAERMYTLSASRGPCSLGMFQSPMIIERAAVLAADYPAWKAPHLALRSFIMAYPPMFRP